MVSAPFASVVALQTFLQDPALDVALAADALADATGLIRAATGQWISLVEDDVEEVEIRTATDTFVLAQFPVVAIAKIETYSDTGATWSEVPAIGYRWLTSGVVRSTGWGAHWPFGYGRVRVTYDHGHPVIDETTPPGLHAVCLSIAARRTVNPQGRIAVSLGAFSESYGASGPVLITPAEERVLSAFRSPRF